MQPGKDDSLPKIQTLDRDCLERANTHPAEKTIWDFTKAFCSGEMKLKKLDSEIKLLPYYKKWWGFFTPVPRCGHMQTGRQPRQALWSKSFAQHVWFSLFAWRVLFHRIQGKISWRPFFSAEIAIVVCKEFQNRHIGRRCAKEILKLAREKDMDFVRANIYSFNPQNRHMFESIGFY